MLHEDGTGCLHGGLECDRWVGLLPTAGLPAAQEDAWRHMDSGHRLGRLAGQLASQGQQPAGVVAMVMTQDHVSDAGEIDLQVTSIVQYGLGPESGIEQD